MKLGFRKSQIGVVMTFCIAALLGMMALSTDVGVMYYNWMVLQKAADAAALAGATYFLPQNGAQTLPRPTIAGGCKYETQQQNVACTYALKNYAQRPDITQGGIYVPAQHPPRSVPAGAQTIQVMLKRTNIPSFFMRALGGTAFHTAAVSATAVQPTPVSSIHNGLFPAGMPPNPLNDCPASTPNGCLSYGTQFQLTNTYGFGNWGWLNLPIGWNGSMGPRKSGGADLLYKNILNGCICEVKVGDVIATTTGDDWTLVSTAVNSLIKSAGLPSTLTGNEAQLVTMPIVDWGIVNGATQVKVLGFAEVWICGIVKFGSNEILTVQFVQYISKIASSGGGPNDYGAFIQPYLVE